MNKLLQFLSNNSLSDLGINHGVDARRSNDNSKFSLNYNQFSSRPGDEIAELCRGIVLRPKNPSSMVTLASDDWQNVILGECYYLARTMKRFYNHGESYAANIDYSCPNLHIMDKLDGTMTALYFDDIKNDWFVATRSVPEANLPFEEFTKMTFSDLFWKGYVNSISETKDTSFLDRSITYIFELTSAYNKIVVSYDTPQVTIISLVETSSGREIDIYSNEGKNLLPNAPRPKKLFVPSNQGINVSEIYLTINSFSPSELEGVVLCDGNFNRIKIKSAAYVLAHRSKDILDTSPSSALLSVLDGTIDDVLPLLEGEIRLRFEKIRDAAIKYMNHLDSIFEEAISKTSSRKEFAIYVNNLNEWTAPLFGIMKIREESKDIKFKAYDWVLKNIAANRWTSNMSKEILNRIACYINS
jgi:hypothetical protein